MQTMTIFSHTKNLKTYSKYRLCCLNKSNIIQGFLCISTYSLCVYFSRLFAVDVHNLSVGRLPFQVRFALWLFSHRIALLSTRRKMSWILIVTAFATMWDSLKVISITTDHQEFYSILPWFGLETSREEIFGHILSNFGGSACIRKNQFLLFTSVILF